MSLKTAGAEHARTADAAPDGTEPDNAASVGAALRSADADGADADGAEPDRAELERLVAALTVEEKVALVVGADAWSTTPIPRIGLRDIRFSDGPVGVRGTDATPDATSAMMPAPSALAATWDVGLAARTGALFAAEARRHGVDVILAPQVNLQRTPVGGRHFECYSEDPHLTSEIAVALVRDCQAGGVGMCVKHFVANDSETERTSYLARVDERTLREAYLPPFERTVHEGGAWSVMGAYSGVDDGHYAAPMLEHRPLLTGVLKDEWGFDGVVVSDWVATKSVAGAVAGGLDLQMPGSDGVWGEGLLDAVRAGEVAERDLDDKVLRLLRLAVRVGALDVSDPSGAPAAAVPERPTSTVAQSAAFLRELAARSTVVLKDDHALLPLDLARRAPAGRPVRIALLGPAATQPFLQGGGSSFVRPDRVTTPAAELARALPEGVELIVLDGARSRLKPPPLDVASRATGPDGRPGIGLELLAGDGTVLRTWTDPAWAGWDRDLPADAATLRVRADLHLDEPGEHIVGFGTVGVRDVRIGDAQVSVGGEVADENVVLNSEYNHPAIASVTATGPATVRLAADLQVVHAVGYGSFARGVLVHTLPGPSREDELAAAVAAAAEADLTIVVVGTTEEVESEGFDRPDLDLPGNQDELVDRVLAVSPDTIVVVNAGAPVLLPWYDRAPTVLWAWLAGQEAGTAFADVLLGATEPSGRLPWTLPARAQDVPVPDAIPRDGVVDYSEGLDIGYRAWERSGATPAAPFGHGLGWTTWEYDAARVVEPGAADGDDVVVEVEVRNSGPRAGREIVQVYAEPDGTAGRGSTGAATDSARPVRWLAGFATVDVAAGESATVRVRVPARALQAWDTTTHDWTVPPGGHRLRVGRSVRDLRRTLHLADRRGSQG